MLPSLSMSAATPACLIIVWQLVVPLHVAAAPLLSSFFMRFIRCRLQISNELDDDDAEDEPEKAATTTMSIKLLYEHFTYF